MDDMDVTQRKLDVMSMWVSQSVVFVFVDTRIRGTKFVDNPKGFVAERPREGVGGKISEWWSRGRATSSQLPESVFGYGSQYCIQDVVRRTCRKYYSVRWSSCEKEVP
jgi:hypothetical protein